MLPGSLAFISPVRKLLYGKYRGVLRIGDTEGRYIRFWPDLLRMAGRGTPISRLILRKPSLTIFTDASKRGMGGYCNETGIGWRYEFPEGVLKHTTINHMEFLAMIVFLMIIVEECGETNPHILAWIDNASAVSWVRRVPRSDEFAAFLFEVYCTILLRAKFSLWGAHLAGAKNVVADVLSRDLDLSIRDVLGKIIRKGEEIGLTTSCDIQVVNIPSPISSWLSRVWETLMQRKESGFRACRANCMHGRDGNSSVGTCGHGARRYSSPGHRQGRGGIRGAHPKAPTLRSS